MVDKNVNKRTILFSNVHPSNSRKEEEELIKCLPSDVVPVSRPSKRIEKLLAKRKDQHTYILQTIKENLRKINTSVEDSLLHKLNIIKNKLDEIRRDTEDVLDNTIRTHDITPNLSKKYADEANNKIVESNLQSISYIEQFAKMIETVEKFRAARYKEILKNGYEEMLKIHYKLPYDIQEFIEEKIMFINKITLNNYRNYSDLVIQLKMQTENEIRVWIIELIKFREQSTIEEKKKRVKSLIEGDTKYKVFDMNDAMRMSFDFSTIVPSNVSEVEIWSRQTQHTLNTLDINAKKLVDLYKTAVLNVFNRFFNELQKVTDEFTIEKEARETDFDYINSEIYKPVIEEITEQYTCEVGELQALWTKITSYMQSNITRTCTFLHSATHLWDDHFERINQAQDIILKHLKLVIDIHDKTAWNSEKQLNMATDKLRQESTPSRLEKNLNSIYKILDSISDKFALQCQKETDIFEDYQKLIELEIDVLLSEIERFLNENSPNDDSKTHRFSLDAAEWQNREHLIPTQIRACHYQVDAVNNWMFGLWETINVYIKSCKKEVTDQAEAWMARQVEKIEKRMEVKMAVHRPRYKRMKSVIYDTRLKELQQHSEGVENLELNITKYIGEVAQNNQISKDFYNTSLHKYNEQLEKIEEKLAKFNDSKQVAFLISNLNYITKEKKALLENHFKENSKINEGVVNKIKVSIYKFAKSIKFFAEGGNYSGEEAKMTMEKLKILDKIAPKYFNQEFKDASRDQMTAINTLESCRSAVMKRLILVKEEFVFNENVLEKVEKIQRDIRRQIYDIKIRIKGLEDSFRYLQEVTSAALDFFEIDYFINIFDEIVEKIGELASYLLLPEGEIENYNLDNRESLFKKPPPETDNYIAKFQFIICTSFQQLQDLATTFYRQHPHVVNSEKIKQNLNSFTDEITKLYISYEEQCQINWMEYTHSLITDILKIYDFLEDFSMKLLTTFINTHTLAFKSLISKIENSISVKQDKLNQSYFDLYNELKKRTIISKELFMGDLQREFILKNEENITTITEFITENNEFLTANYEKIIEKLKIIDGVLESTKNNAFLREIITNLNAQLKKVLDTWQRHLQIPDEDSSSIEKLIGISEDSKASMEKLEIFREYFLSLKPLSETETKGLGEMIQIALLEFRKDYNETTEKISGINNMLENIINEFKDLWGLN